jgi:hypothetical protein
LTEVWVNLKSIKGGILDRFRHRIRTIGEIYEIFKDYTDKKR